MKGSLYLVDASIYIFQAHFSPHMQIWSQRSEDRSAFAGFARFLLRFLQLIRPWQEDPLGVAVAFDESLFSGFRHRLYADYKSNRILPDDNLALQLDACSRLCTTLGIHAFGSQEYEADDIIGTLARKSRTQQADTVVSIVSRDKDLAQLLLREEDYIWDFQARERRYRQDVHERYGIWPEQLPCFLGLTGDSIDCIPGVPGIGPVAAKCLLQHFGDLDLLYSRLAEVPQLPMRGAASCAKKLQQHEELARLSRELATIVTCEDSAESFAGISADALQPTPLDESAFRALLGEMDLAEQECNRLEAMLQPLSNSPERAEGV